MLDSVIAFVQNLRDLSALVREEWKLSRQIIDMASVLENKRIDTLKKAFHRYSTVLGEVFGPEIEAIFTRTNSSL